ncbi:hypothetical protein BaRGS_00014826 [Batillaria attramentaria]|uniref:Uncharacterized protein n=1 Tax=Batillaria attramentaria TaxID=370345 RepID=A0ABD0L4A5_9CAEN
MCCTCRVPARMKTVFFPPVCSCTGAQRWLPHEGRSPLCPNNHLQEGGRCIILPLFPSPGLPSSQSTFLLLQAPSLSRELPENLTHAYERSFFSNLIYDTYIDTSREKTNTLAVNLNACILSLCQCSAVQAGTRL